MQRYAERISDALEGTESMISEVTQNKIKGAVSGFPFTIRDMGEYYAVTFLRSGYATRLVIPESMYEAAVLAENVRHDFERKKAKVFARLKKWIAEHFLGSFDCVELNKCVFSFGGTTCTFAIQCYWTKQDEQKIQNAVRMYVNSESLVHGDNNDIEFHVQFRANGLLYDIEARDEGDGSVSDLTTVVSRVIRTLVPNYT